MVFSVFSETALRIFLIFCMKLGDYKGRKVTGPDFLKKILIWRYSRKSLQISPKSDTLGHFINLASFVFLDFAHNDRWVWCVVVFLQFVGPGNVFLFDLKRLFPSQDIRFFMFPSSLFFSLSTVALEVDQRFMMPSTVEIRT